LSGLLSRSDWWKKELQAFTACEGNMKKMLPMVAKSSTDVAKIWAKVQGQQKLSEADMCLIEAGISAVAETRGSLRAGATASLSAMLQTLLQEVPLDAPRFQHILAEACKLYPEAVGLKDRTVVLQTTLQMSLQAEKLQAIVDALKEALVNDFQCIKALGEALAGARGLDYKGYQGSQDQKQHAMASNALQVAMEATQRLHAKVFDKPSEVVQWSQALQEIATKCQGCCEEETQHEWMLMLEGSELAGKAMMLAKQYMTRGESMEQRAEQDEGLQQIAEVWRAREALKPHLAHEADDESPSDWRKQLLLATTALDECLVEAKGVHERKAQENLDKALESIEGWLLPAGRRWAEVVAEPSDLTAVLQAARAFIGGVPADGFKDAVVLVGVVEAAAKRVAEVLGGSVPRASADRVLRCKAALAVAEAEALLTSAIESHVAAPDVGRLKRAGHVIKRRLEQAHPNGWAEVQSALRARTEDSFKLL